MFVLTTLLLRLFDVIERLQNSIDQSSAIFKYEPTIIINYIIIK